MNPRIIHDEAWQAANAIMTVFVPKFGAAEVKEAHALVYECVKAAIERVYLRREEERRRLNPTLN
jgi:hypothetical protein